MVPSMIDIGEVSKPVTVLLEKISSAIGILYEPTRIVKKAKAESKANKIMRIGEFELETELQVRAMNRLKYEETNKQKNIDNIVKIAIPEIEETANPDKIDDDWINQFFSKCKNTSNEEIQIIWAKILAGEANKPGSFSFQTLYILEQMQKEQAFAFNALTKCTLLVSNVVLPFIDEPDDVFYTSKNITFEGLLNLQRLGLIYFNPESGYSKIVNKNAFTTFIYGIGLSKIHSNKPNNRVPLGKVMYSSSGKEILNIIGYKSDPEIGQRFKKQLIKNNYTVEEI